MILAVVLAAGSRGTAPAPRSTDMWAGRYEDSIGAPNHLGHWVAPSPGVPLFISANSTNAGNNGGGTTVTFGILRVRSGVETTVCTLSIACTLAPGDPVQKTDCVGGEFLIGDELHITFDHSCAQSPAGGVTVGFVYDR